MVAGPREEERAWLWCGKVFPLPERSDRGPGEAERCVGIRSEVGPREDERMVPILSGVGPREEERVVGPLEAERVVPIRSAGGPRDADLVMPRRGCEGRPMGICHGSGDWLTGVGRGSGGRPRGTILGSGEWLVGKGFVSDPTPIDIGLDGARGREKFSLCGIAGLGCMPISAISLTKSSDAGL